jgi:hypothetical protein
MKSVNTAVVYRQINYDYPKNNAQCDLYKLLKYDSITNLIIKDIKDIVKNESPIVNIESYSYESNDKTQNDKTYVFTVKDLKTVRKDIIKGPSMNNTSEVVDGLEVPRQHRRQMVGQFTIRRCRDFAGVRCQFAGLIQRFLPRLPFRETAGPPFAQVLLADGAAAKLPRQHCLHCGQRVEPREQRAARLSVLQTAVQCLAEVTRQAGDFSIAGHG